MSLYIEASVNSCGTAPCVTGVLIFLVSYILVHPPPKLTVIVVLGYCVHMIRANETHSSARV
jgi:hypothetical protein